MRRTVLAVFGLAIAVGLTACSSTPPPATTTQIYFVTGTTTVTVTHEREIQAPPMPTSSTLSFATVSPQSAAPSPSMPTSTIPTPVTTIAANSADFITPAQVNQRVIAFKSGHMAIGFPVITSAGEKPPLMLPNTPSSADDFMYGTLVVNPGGDRKLKPGTVGSFVQMYSLLGMNAAKTLYCANSYSPACASANEESYSVYIYQVASTNAAAAFTEIHAYTFGVKPSTNSLGVPSITAFDDEDGYATKLVYVPGQVIQITGNGRFASQFVKSFRFVG